VKFAGNRLDHKDPDGDRLSADFYHGDGVPSTGFLVMCIGQGGFSKAVRLDRKEAKKFAKRILKELERA
jgi:hypothetical protein